jgi:uncharacterized protein involved in exopolysaccharide biosynthesis
MMKKIGRRRFGAWIVWGIIVFVAVSLTALYLYPQNYSATVSVSMQQPNSSSSALQALTGNTTKKYTGVIKSRSFAEKVDKKVHFRELMRMKATPRDQTEALEKVMKDLKVDDNAADGLLYITVNLAGPPRLWPDPGSARRDELRAAVAKAANLYRDALQDHLTNTDTDKESALLRGADVQVEAAYEAYRAAINRLGDYVKRSRISMVPNGGSSSGGSTADATTGGSLLSSVYARRGELLAKMASLDKGLNAQRALVNSPVESLIRLPEEDPLLVNARRNVLEAQANLDTLQIQYGSSMQSVRRAKERLKLAHEQLHKEVQSVLKGNTSEQVKRQALQAEYDSIEQQIASAERNFQDNRTTGIEIEKLRNDVTVKLETLKTAKTEYARLSLTTVSGKNRMATIDEAREPIGGTPGIALLLSVAALATVLFIAVWWIVEYLITSHKAYSQEALVRG